MNSLARALSPLLLLCALQGCALTLPVEGTPEVVRHSHSELAGDSLVSIGPRRLLEIFGRLLRAQDPALEVMDGLQFRDAAYPQGGWQLQELLQPGRSQALAAQLDVDLLLLVSPLAYSQGEERGIFIPLVFGAQSMQHRAVLSVSLLDLRRGQLLDQVQVSASEDERVLYYVVVFTGTTPRVHTPVLQRAAHEAARLIHQAAPGRRPRIALLALEPAQR